MAPPPPPPSEEKPDITDRIWGFILISLLELMPKQPLGISTTRIYDVIKSITGLPYIYREIQYKMLDAMNAFPEVFLKHTSGRIVSFRLSGDYETRISRAALLDSKEVRKCASKFAKHLVTKRRAQVYLDNISRMENKRAVVLRKVQLKEACEARVKSLFKLSLMRQARSKPSRGRNALPEGLNYKGLSRAAGINIPINPY